MSDKGTEPDPADPEELNTLEASARMFARKWELESAARYVVQQHARLQDSEAALVASHGELDAAREGSHSRVALMLVQFAAAARRAVRHYRRLEDAGIVNLRTALGMSATPTRDEIGQAVPDVAPVEPAAPGIATEENEDHGSSNRE
jgi:hypothetical protein